MNRREAPKHLVLAETPALAPQVQVFFAVATLRLTPYPSLRLGGALGGMTNTKEPI